MALHTCPANNKSGTVFQNAVYYRVYETGRWRKIPLVRLWVQDGYTIFGKTSATSTGNVYRPRVGSRRVNTHVDADWHPSVTLRCALGRSGCVLIITVHPNGTGKFNVDRIAAAFPSIKIHVIFWATWFTTGSSDSRSLHYCTVTAVDYHIKLKLIDCWQVFDKHD